MKRIFYAKDGRPVFMNSFWISVFVFFIGSHQGMSLSFQRQLGDTLIASQLNLKAIELARTKQIDSAISFFEKAAVQYMQADAWDRFYYAHAQIGYLFNSQYKYSQTFHHLDSVATSNSQHLIPTLNSYQDFYGVLAWSQFSLRNYEQALYYFKIIDRGATQNNRVKPGQILFSKYHQGVIYQRIGQYDLALKFMLQTRDIGNEFKDNTYLSRSYNNLGIINRNLGEYQRALEFYQKALITEKQYKKEVALTPIYNNIGLIYYYLNENDVAIRELDHALDVLTTFTSQYYSVESALINTKAKVLLAQEHYDQALEILQQVLAREVAHNGESWVGSGPTLEMLGDLYAKVGDYGTSNNYYKLSNTITLNDLGPKTDKLSITYNSLCQNYLHTKSYDSALYTIQKNLISLVADFNEPAYDDNPKINSVIFNKVELIEALYLKAKVLLALFSATGEINYLQGAKASNETATELVNIVRKNMLYESSKMNLSKRAKTIYEQTIFIALLLEKETGRAATGIVFEAMENSKAYLLSEAMQKAKALGYSNLPLSILAKEDSFRTKLKVLAAKRANIQLHSKDSIALAEIGEQLFSTKESFEIYKQSYATSNPVYQNNLLNLSSIQEKLTENELIIEYFAGEKQLYSIALSKNKIRLYELGDIQQSINEFIGAVKKVKGLDAANYQGQAHKVYDIILAPILADFKESKRLVIIPDKQLGYIPFDALVDEVVDNPRYNRLAYLLKKYTLLQHQTVGLYIERQHRHDNTAEQFIGFAPDFDENDLLVVANNQLRSDLQPLPFAKKEVEAISNLLDGEEVTGPNASESYLKSKAASFNILHLATHAIIDEENPLYSKLVFAFGDSTALDDGELHSYEIYGMKLNCALVTLSACNTGSGKYMDGEGIFSLGRSFLLAGAESVLTSLWEVSDQSTAQIMESFYTNIKKGATSPDALRAAKLEYLKSSDPLTANPHYWAGFVYIGQTENIINSYKLNYWLAAILILFISFTVISLKVKKKKFKHQAR